MNTRRLVSRSLLICLLLLAPVALAWGPLGHRLVGDLAARQLTPAARAEVARLLAGEPEPTLGGVASWADQLRDTDPDRFKATSRWHYINAKGGGCDFDVARDCKDGDCVVRAVEEQAKILADKAQPLEKRRDALKFIVHFVGDMHQPMHAGNRDDAGGNKFQVSLRTSIQPEEYARKNYVNGVMGTNLHSVWDYYILAAADRKPAAYARKLRDQLPPKDDVSVGAPLAWATESCALIDAKSIYPQQHVMTHAYLDAMRPLAEKRLVTAAVRLAELLNTTLR